MGRTRTKNKALPKHCVLQHGTYYYRVEPRFQHLFEKKWVRLGKNLPDSHRVYAELPIHEEIDFRKIRTIAQLADHYEQQVLPRNAIHTHTDQGNTPPEARHLKGLITWQS